ncbi:MAG: aminomethyltransferase [Pirellulales bacterium]|nr:aminomethyltransferase [Pirellulales bacterium]
MNTHCYQLDSVSVLDILGTDAEAIVHNLTTNDVRKLGEGQGCESFVTDVRGKTLGHVVVFRQSDGFRMIGAGSQSEKLAAHQDRYTIREDAQALIRDSQYVALVLPAETTSVIGQTFSGQGQLRSDRWALSSATTAVYQTPWLGKGTVLILETTEQVDELKDWLQERGVTVQTEESFHHRRTHAGFPWYGIDLDETNLPQEAERNEQAISLTKGCYLGQETVARLDALGQVQKKLVRWSISEALPASGATLSAGDKKVGRLTSIAPGGDQLAVAIGYARRSHFEPGTEAEGVVEASGNRFVGRVLGE